MSVTVLHHALLQDHPGVLWEQGIASSDHSHPGDIYHPDFSLGHPAYFDPLLLRLGWLLLPVRIHYLETVINLLFPICESFGVRSPFTLSTLSTISLLK